MHALGNIENTNKAYIELHSMAATVVQANLMHAYVSAVQYRVLTCLWFRNNNSCLIDWVVFNVPLNTLSVISGTGFYGSNDPITTAQ